MNPFKRIPVLRNLDEAQIEKWSSELMKLIRESIAAETLQITDYVKKLRELNPNISNIDLANKIVSRKSLSASGIGAITGVGGIFTLPISMPTDIYFTFKIQVRMVLSIADVFGWSTNDDTITDVLMIIGGKSAITVAKDLGVAVGNSLTAKFVSENITREVMKKINNIVSRKIITKAGEKSLTSFTKLIPLVGAPIGASFDGIGTYLIGKTAIKFYRG